MKRLLFLITLALSAVFCRAQIPEFSNRLVNDYANVLSTDEVRSMESRLRNYYDTTSNCIIVVIINDLGGYEASDFAQRLGEKWGVGTGKYSNGLVILLSPEGHEVFIATGYGLEGVLPDVTCHRIAEKYMKPHFREEEYYEGLEAGLDIILPVAAKEYSFEDLQKEQEAEDMEELLGFLTSMGIVVLSLLLIVAIASYRKKHPSKKKLALQAFAKVRTRNELAEAIAEAKRVRVKKEKVDKAVADLRTQRVEDVAHARTYKLMVDSMSVALDLGADEQQVQMARSQAVAGIIGGIGSARSVTALQSAIREAELAGAKEHEIANGREKALSGTLSDLSKAVSVKALRNLEEAATSFGAKSVDVQRAKELAGRNALSRVSSPKSMDDVTEAIELAEKLGVPSASIASAKDAGSRHALEKIARAGSSDEVREAAELALFLGAAALAVAAARKLAMSRLRPTVSRAGRSSWGGGSFSGGGSSGTFGGFGGGHFGGGGGGAKW
jgi:uncharacterized protein